MTSMAGHGVAGLGWAMLGKAPLFEVWRVPASRGRAWPGTAPLNPSWQGVARLGASPHGMAPLFLVGLGLAGPGRARHGRTPLGGLWQAAARLGLTWQGMAPLYTVGQGQARQVGARQGRSRHGSPWFGVARLLSACQVRTWRGIASLGLPRLPLNKTAAPAYLERIAAVLDAPEVLTDDEVEEVAPLTPIAQGLAEMFEQALERALEAKLAERQQVA